MSHISKNQILSLTLSLCLLGLQNGSARAQIIPMAMWNKPNVPPTLSAVTNKQFNAGAVISTFDSGGDGGDDYDADSNKITYRCYFDTTVNGSVASSTSCSTANFANGTGFVFDGATGVISGWQPDKDAVYEVKIVGCDASAACGSTIFTITTVVDCAGLAGGAWVKVPGDTIYSTSNFCVQKYAPSDVSSVPTSSATGTPWVTINQIDSIMNCASLGASYHLITNPEWMTVAANIANKAENWSGSSVGSGTLSRGHSDSSPTLVCPADANDANGYVEGSCTGTNSGTFSQRRTQFLSNGAVIWDIAGNLLSWVDYYNRNDKPTPATYAYYEHTAITGSTTTPRSHYVPINSQQSWWIDSWNAVQGIGRTYPGPNGQGGGLVRGGAHGILSRYRASSART